MCPDKRKDFCQECGAPTIIACPSCDKAIEGTQIKARPDYSGGRSGHSGMVPGGPLMFLTTVLIVVNLILGQKTKLWQPFKRLQS